MQELEKQLPASDLARNACWGWESIQFNLLLIKYVGYVAMQLYLFVVCSLLTDTKSEWLYLHSSTNNSKEYDWKQPNDPLGVWVFLMMKVWKCREAGSSALKTIDYMQNWQGEFSCFNPDVFILSRGEETSMKIYKGSGNMHNEMLEKNVNQSHQGGLGIWEFCSISMYWCSQPCLNFNLTQFGNALYCNAVRLCTVDFNRI